MLHRVEPGRAMTDASRRPGPEVAESMKPYWEAAGDGVLALAWCDTCGAVANYGRPFCSRCLSQAMTWRPAAGTGHIYSFTVVRQARHPYFAGRAPYVVAIVELDEGPRLLTNIVGCDPGDVRI